MTLRIRWDSALLVIFTITVFALVAYRMLTTGNPGEPGQSLIEREIEWASEIEGLNLFELVRMAPGMIESKQNWKSMTNRRFVLIIGDSVCKPCFGNLVKDFVVRLNEHQCEFDPSQWSGVFVGRDTSLGEATFRGVFGKNALFVKDVKMERISVEADDGLVLYTTTDNTVLACTRFVKSSRQARSHFVKRVRNALRPTVSRM